MPFQIPPPPVLQSMDRSRPFSLVACVVVTILLAGCASSKPTPDPGVEDARGENWVVVPLVVPDTVVSGRERISDHNAVVSTVSEFFPHADQPFQVGADTTERGAEAAMPLFDFYRVDSLSQEREDVALRESVLDSLRDRAGSRYVLAVQGVRWSSTTGRVVRDIGIAVVASAISLGVGFDYVLVPSGPSDGTIVVMELVDARTHERVTGGAVQSNEDQFDPTVHALLFKLLTGRELTPSSFDVDVSDDVLVYRYEKPTIVGTGFRVEGGEAVVEREDEGAVRIPVDEVKRVKSTLQNRFIFPAKEAK